ncbi:hypothetical protein [Actinacidiphila rubida]|uniref:Uncharacterized protein n=1 Tax=Actinacidiphila rubida TaxID=310780 RepID=A0A1H8RES2_9ACTN|nr:hypothetical protein [Actinacidiphila rubida]SEO64941.1 hypothetical protein SAMN05216267_103445 [Actinacidiphila rubida]
MTPRRRPRRRALPRVLVRVPGCLALVCGLLLCGTGPSSAAPAWADPMAPRVLPLPPSGVRSPGAVVTARVDPAAAVVGQDENGEFTLTLTDVGDATAYNVRVLLDDAQPGNAVGSADGRCLSRLDASSPADLWCELGDVAPGQTVSVTVHTFMNTCVWSDPATMAPRLPAAAFRWRIAYLDVDEPRTVNGPVARWSCAGDAAGGNAAGEVRAVAPRSS